MLGTIVDHRSNPHRPEVDAVFEPSFHDNVRDLQGRLIFVDVMDHPSYFIVTATYDTTVRDAVLRAETAWPFEVTVYLYDAGYRPLG